MTEREQPLAQDGHSPGSRPGTSLRRLLTREAPLGIGLAILGLMLLAWFGLLGWGWVLAGSLSLLGFLLVWARLRLGPFVGPLYFYELLRLARRGRTTLLRFAYGLALLALLCYFYAEHFPDRDLLEQAFAPGWNLSRSAMARFSHHFVIAFLIVQSIAIYVLTPIYLGGAIAEEKERRTLELLLTTHLRDHEIIFGKLLARLTHLLLLLLMGVPILCLTSLMGGVHYLLLVAGFVATFVSLLTLGCLSICISVLSRTSLGAISGTYGVLLVFLCGIICLGSPASLVIALEDVLKEGSPLNPLEATLTHLGVYTLVQGLIGAFCAFGAVAQLRLGGDLPPLAEKAPPPRLVPVSPVFDDALPPSEPRPRPPAARTMVHIGFPRLLDEEPLLWKEAYRGTGEVESTFGCAIVGMFVYFLAVLLPFAASFPSMGMSWQQGLNRALRVFFVLLMTAWSVLTALRTVGSLSRERDQRTLDALLTLPFSHRAILRACWVGGIARFRYLGYCLAACLLVGLLSGAFHPLAVMLLVLTGSASLALLAGMGVWLALATRTTLWAYVSMALILLVFFGGAWALLFSGPGVNGWEEIPTAWESHLIQVGLNPLAAWWVAGFSWDDLADLDAPLFRAHLQAVHAGIGILSLLAWLLWRAALHRLHSRLK